jgi:flagellar export protein FliJ
MAKFKFRLATLMRLREHTRDERRVELAEAYRVDNILKERIGNLVEEMESMKSRQRTTSQPGTVDIDLLVESQRYEVALKAQQREFEQQRQTIAVEIDRRQQRLIEANREVRVLEKLQETQLDRHREEENRREGKVLDEAAQQKAVREAVR